MYGWKFTCSSPVFKEIIMMNFNILAVNLFIGECKGMNIPPNVKEWTFHPVDDLSISWVDTRKLLGQLAVI